MTQITVVIRLTSAQHIDAIRDRLEQILPDFSKNLDENLSFQTTRICLYLGRLKA